MWLDDERQQLLEEAAYSVRQGKLCNDAATRRRRAVALVEESKDSQACKALTSQGLAPSSTDTLDAMNAAHPTGPPVDVQSLGMPPLANPITRDQVLAALKGFAKGSAPGPSGLRAQHLLDAVSGPEQAGALEALVDLVNLLASGYAPSWVAKYVAGAQFLALPKENDGVRPIAVGEVLRRLVSKTLCCIVEDEAADLFTPLQVGVACPLGVEAAIHVLSQYV